MTFILRYMPFLFLSSLCAMDAQKSIHKISYRVLMEELQERNLVPRATAGVQPSWVRERIGELILSLQESGSFSLDEKVSTLAVIEGKETEGNPRTLVRDFAAYCALLCFEKESARNCFEQDLMNLNMERVLFFFPRLFCVAVHRKCLSLACSILKAATSYFVEKVADSRENVRTYFAVLLPIFFLADDSDGLIQICSELGANYLLPEEIALLLNVREGNAELLTDYASISNTQAYVPFLKALLLGCCMKRSKNSLVLVKMLISKLFCAKVLPTYTFFCLMLREAERAGNSEVVALLNELSFVE